MTRKEKERKRIADEIERGATKEEVYSTDVHRLIADRIRKCHSSPR